METHFEISVAAVCPLGISVSDQLFEVRDGGLPSDLFGVSGRLLAGLSLSLEKCALSFHTPSVA